MNKLLKQLLPMGLGLALSVIAAASAQAGTTTIDFNTLGGANGDPFTPYSENGFTVTPTAGSWFVAQSFGNPVPDIFAGPVGNPTTSTVEVTKNGGGTFDLISTDFATNNGTSDFTFTGFLGGGLVFTTTGPIPPGPPFMFFTEGNPFSNSPIDTAFITITPTGGPTSMNLDNIVLTTTIPEPSSLVMAGIASLLGLALVSRRRKRAG
jgi:hypothetical protein